MLLAFWFDTFWLIRKVLFIGFFMMYLWLLFSFSNWFVWVKKIVLLWGKMLLNSGFSIMVVAFGLGFYPMFCSLRLMFSNFIKRCFSLINHLNRLFILFILKMMILSFIIITLIPSWRKYGRINIMLMILVHFFLPRLISRNRMIMNRWLQLPLILITLTNPITITILFLRETITRLLSNHLILFFLVIMNLVVY